MDEKVKRKNDAWLNLDIFLPFFLIGFSTLCPIFTVLMLLLTSRLSDSMQLSFPLSFIVGFPGALIVAVTLSAVVPALAFISLAKLINFVFMFIAGNLKRN